MLYSVRVTACIEYMSLLALAVIEIQPPWSLQAASLPLAQQTSTSMHSVYRVLWRAFSGPRQTLNERDRPQKQLGNFAACGASPLLLPCHCTFGPSRLEVHGNLEAGGPVQALITT